MLLGYTQHPIVISPLINAVNCCKVNCVAVHKITVILAYIRIAIYIASLEMTILASYCMSNRLFSLAAIFSKWQAFCFSSNFPESDSEIHYLMQKPNIVM